MSIAAILASTFDTADKLFIDNATEKLRDMLISIKKETPYEQAAITLKLKRILLAYKLY